MSLSALTAIEKIETERRAAAEARNNELRAVAYVNVESGKPWVSIEDTEAATLQLLQKLLADDAFTNIEILTRRDGDIRRERILLADRRERDAKEREERRIRNTPVVGKGATEHLHTDKCAYAVVSVGKAVAEDGRPKTIKILRLEASDYGIEVGPLSGYDQGGYPVVGHRFTEAEIELALASDYDPRFVETARLRKDGRYYGGHGNHITFGPSVQMTDYRF